MLHMVNFPTRFQNNHSSAIDNIFVNNSCLYLCNILLIYNGLSGHDAHCLILIFFFFVKENIISGKFETRLFTTDTISYFQELLLKETWEDIYQEHDINDIFNNFLKKYLNNFEATFPVIYRDKHKDNAWITRGIRISCQRKRSLFILSRN